MDKRTEFVEKLSTEIVAWDVQIDRLRDKMENAAAGEEFECWLTGAIVQHKRDRVEEIRCSLAATGRMDWEKLEAEVEEIQKDLGQFLAAIALEQY